MDRAIRRRLRWRPARIDFLTWAVCAVWDGAGRLMAGVQDLKAAVRRPQRRRNPPLWFGSRPA